MMSDSKNNPKDSDFNPKFDLNSRKESTSQPIDEENARLLKQEI